MRKISLPTGIRSTDRPARSQSLYRLSFWAHNNCFNPLNAELNPICHLLALLGTHPILHIGRIKVKFSKVCARWVPKELTEDHKRKRLDVCSRHLARFREEGDKFLQQIVTSDETWIHHYEPESKRQSMQWKHSLSPVAKKLKTQPSAGKFMLTLFWDPQGPYSRNLSGKWNNCHKCNVL